MLDGSRLIYPVWVYVAMGICATSSRLCLRSLIDAAEEDIAYNVAFLMLDTALKLSLPERTLPVMQWLDRNLKPEKEHKVCCQATPRWWVAAGAGEGGLVKVLLGRWLCDG